VALWKDFHREISIGKKDSFHERIRFEFEEETNEMLHTERSLFGTETWKLENINQKYFESTAISCWRRMKKSVGLIVYKIKSQGRKEHPTYDNTKKDNWIGCIWRTSCLPKCVIKRKIERKRDGTRRHEGRRKQLLNDNKEKRGYCNVKDGTM
jgi:hypothetical protein